MMFLSGVGRGVLWVKIAGLCIKIPAAQRESELIITID